MQCNFIRPQAIALIKGGSVMSAVIGTVKFYQKHNGVMGLPT